MTNGTWNIRCFIHLIFNSSTYTCTPHVFFFHCVNRVPCRPFLYISELVNTQASCTFLCQPEPFRLSQSKGVLMQGLVDHRGIFMDFYAVLRLYNKNMCPIYSSYSLWEAPTSFKAFYYLFKPFSIRNFGNNWSTICQHVSFTISQTVDFPIPNRSDNVL